MVGQRMTFGRFLRESRLTAGYGLRAFAIAIGMQPSNLSNMEHGRIAPPQELQKLEQMAEVLGFSKGSKQWQRLSDLAVQHKPTAIPPDVATFAARKSGIPTLLRTIENARLSKKDLADLSQYIKEHLKKA